jgi:putative membrane protein
MKTASLTLAATLLAGAAFAQGTAPSRTTPGATPGATSNAPMPGASSSTGTMPGAGVVDRNTGTAAASGDRNQAVATTGANAPQPAQGRNSFTQGEAQRRIESRGFQGVSGLHKDQGGVWRGTATRDGASVPVWLDYKGNVGPQASTAQGSSMPGSTATPGSGMGSPSGTAAGRATDRALGGNPTGTGAMGTTGTGAMGTAPMGAGTMGTGTMGTTGAPATGTARP